MTKLMQRGQLACAMFLCLCVSLAEAAVTRGPYLQMGTPSSTTIRWRTDTASTGRVWYGTTSGNLTLIASEGAATTEHVVTVSGLNANTKYFYQIGDTAGNRFTTDDGTYYFKTSPVPGTVQPVRVWVIGDAGTGTSNQAAVRDAFVGFTGTTHADVWLQLGDNAYSSGTDSEYQSKSFNMYPNQYRQWVCWLTRGNHERTNSSGSVYYNIFTMPTNAEAGGIASGTEHYYSFNYANIHFICLDSQGESRSSTGAMANWLRNDLADNLLPWVVAYWHHPPYSKGSHNSDTESQLVEMRTNILPILEDYGVDLVLCGHSHSYERSFLIDSHYGVSSTFSSSHLKDGGSGRDSTPYQKAAGPHNGAVYAVPGSSGQISGGTLNHPAMYISLNTLGSMVLDVNGNQLDAKMINSSGGVSDYFTLIKNGPSVLFYDDFQSLTVPNAPSTTKWRYIGSNSAASGSDSTSFGVLTTYAALSGENKSLFTQDISGLPTVTLTSFNFHDASTDDASDGTNIGWVVSGGDLNGTGGALVLSFDQGSSATQGQIKAGDNTTFSGTIPTYTRGVKHKLQIVYNSGGTAVSYSLGGARTVAAESADVFLDNVFVGTYTSNATGASKTPASFGYRNFSADNATNMRIDNVSVDVAPPPPPSTLFADDFQSLTVPNAPSTTKWRYIGSNSAASATDSTSFGTTTIYAVLSGVNRSLFTQSITGMPTVTLTSFDFHDASTDDASDGTNIGWVVSGGDLNGTGGALVLSFDQGSSATQGQIKAGDNTTFSGTIPTYTRGVKHTVQIVYNSGSTSASYFLGTQRTVAAESADVFLDNVFVGTYTSTATGASKVPTSFGYRNFSADNATNMRIDNFSVMLAP